MVAAQSGRSRSDGGDGDGSDGDNRDGDGDGGGQRQPGSAEPNAREALSVEEALWLATRGGARVVDMDDAIGGFERGMSFDAQMVELGPALDDPPDDREGRGDGDGDGDSHGPVDVFGWESWEEKVAKWMWTGDDRNVRAVWVGGRLVHSLRVYS
ncbi:hypothetical protein VTO42DRAFT_6897 [Malbranchea cinnamomea]